MIVAGVAMVEKRGMCCDASSEQLSERQRSWPGVILGMHQQFAYLTR